MSRDVHLAKKAYTPLVTIERAQNEHRVSIPSIQLIDQISK